MCFLLVLFLNLACFFTLSYCTAGNGFCDYKTDPQPQLYIHISRKPDDLENGCVLKELSNTTITFRQQDAMELSCYRVIATSSNAIQSLNVEVLIKWKLQQFNHDLLVVTEEKAILVGPSSIKLILDRYDDGLIARCSSSGNETHNDIHVQFKYKEEKNVSDINEDIENVNITEGQTVRNEFANSVILYNTQDLERDPKVILQNNNIFDSITLEDNGTVYAGWANQSNHNQTIIVKKKWVVYVEPARSRSLFLLGIGGISCIVIVIIIVVCCKYCIKKKENYIENPYAEINEVAHVPPNQHQVNHPNPKAEEEDYAQIPAQYDRVVYAQISTRKTVKSTPMQDSEPYAKIIGVIRPNKKGHNVNIYKG